MRKIVWKSTNFLFFLGTFAHLFNNACHGNTVFASLHSKKGKHMFVREENNGKQCDAFVLLSTPYCWCRRVFKELGCVVIISIPVVKVWVYILHISRYDNVYIVSYVIHSVTSSTRCLWQLGCKCEYVHIFVIWFIPPFPSRLPCILSIQWLCHALRVTTVHPVNHILSYFLSPGSIGVFSSRHLRL